MTDRTWTRLMDLGALAGCHQLAERSFFIGGWQFPVCARCAGLPLGWLAAPFALLALDAPAWVGLILLLPMAVDWGLQRFFSVESTNIRRFITGALGGFGYLLLILRIAMWLGSAVLPRLFGL